MAVIWHLHNSTRSAATVSLATMFNQILLCLRPERQMGIIQLILHIIQAFSETLERQLRRLLAERREPISRATTTFMRGDYRCLLKRDFDHLGFRLFGHS